MRLVVLPALAVSLLCPTALAQLNALYKGVERLEGKENPASAQFAIEPGRIALVIKGERSARLVFTDKDGVLRFIDDGEKMYFDMDEQTINSLGAAASSMMAEMEQQLSQLPPEQRRMAEEMLKGRSGGGAQPNDKAKPKTEYKWTTDKKTVLGYECTRVEIVEGGVKSAEYCAAKSKDFKISEGERKTILAMQKLIEGFASVVSSMGGQDDVQTRAFQWDTSVDGYPLITRCFEDGQVTLDLQLEAFDRKPIAAALFDVPAEYRKQTLPQTP